MAIVKAQRIPKPESKFTSDDVLALFCLKYQQYTFAQAKKLPFRRIKQMLKVADREYAKKMFDLLQITASQHTKKMKGIKDLSDHYKNMMES